MKKKLSIQILCRVYVKILQLMYYIILVEYYEQLLKKNPDDRMKIDEVLSHEWLREAVATL